MRYRDLIKGNKYKAHVHIEDETFETEFVVLGKRQDAVYAFNLTTTALDEEEVDLYLDYILENYSNEDIEDGKEYDDEYIPEDIAEVIDESIVIYFNNHEVQTADLETIQGHKVEIIEKLGKF